VQQNRIRVTTKVEILLGWSKDAYDEKRVLFTHFGFRAISLFFVLLLDSSRAGPLVEDLN
jgi:hypothetical protein